ncbi:MAG: hypothetical protein D8M58_15300 [Calditrichaeota bacterium]|nr:MAG: hypothetical protein DWQ03_16540 [Calditrichota bacterium]MBL1206769.1 hypothetical protein [Calditrichota bacterium]NOG46595.1 hypothetical protein [Calditrichota bacterium]
MNNPLITYCVLLFAICGKLFAQETEQGEYELLAMEIDMLGSYSTFSQNTNALIDSAKEYALKGDYDFAIVYLEEAKSSITTPENVNKPNEISHSKKIFFFNLQTGIDYNRQEFELGFEQSDSVLLDELSKPFVGFDLRYLSDDHTFQLENNLRYDKENLQNELFLQNEFKNSSLSFTPKLGIVFDKNFSYSTLGYLEVFTDLGIKSADINSSWYWSIKNLVRYKRFEQSTETIPNFIRNTFTAYLVKSYNFNKNLQFDYNFDLNESIKYLNNDFSEHDAGISYQDQFFKRLKFRGSIRSRINEFNYLVQDELRDSSFTNRSQTYSVNPSLKYELNPLFSIDLKYKVDFKKFDIKTEQEPDYVFQFINPALITHLNDNVSIKLGYVFEKKSHKTSALLEEQYIKDQNYSSQGIATGLDYASVSGIIISLNAEYMLRRYPNVQEDVTFSIYSNRNILNFLFFAQVPINENISINAIGSYDNDKDIDSDFNDSISSFYTFELTYSF